MTRSFFSFLLVIVSSWSIAVYSAIDSNLEIISEQTQVHIGIISPGAGVSILGHAFVNMSEAGMTPLFGISISYTGVILNGSTRIRVSSNSFPSNYYIDSYNAKNRSVDLYRLNLTLAQKRKFIDLLLEDINNPTFSETASYDLFESNCLSIIVKHLITALGNDQRGKNLRGFFWSRTPLLFESLIPHNDIIGPAEYVFPGFQRNTEKKWVSHILPAIKELQSCNGWTLDRITMVRHLAWRFTKLHYSKDLESLSGLLIVLNCSEKLKNFYTELYNSVPRTEQSIRKQILSIRNKYVSAE